MEERRGPPRGERADESDSGRKQDLVFKRVMCDDRIYRLGKI
jgi:hypothetical protein